jgi:carboxybiotin decarboxylase
MGGTASGVIGANVMNLFLKEKINPLLGSAGIASVPIAARVSAMVALRENPHNFLLMHAMGPNLAGVFGTAISGGIMLALLGVK